MTVAPRQNDDIRGVKKLAVFESCKFVKSTGLRREKYVGMSKVSVMPVVVSTKECGRFRPR